jgi:hypothetical protein
LEVSGLPKEALTPASTPFLPEEAFSDEDGNEEGSLREDSSKVLMKILYGARVARYDLLNPTRALAGCTHKWTRACDKKLHRLVCYINSTVDLTLKGYINDKPEDLYLRLYADADFAGCKKTSRSTSGVFLCLCGPNSWFPIAATSKRQGCVSHSTPEAELVAVDLAMRAEGLPALIIFEKIFGRPIRLVFEEDNQAAISVMKSGYSPALKHMGRTHRVCLKWISERIAEKQVEVNYCLSADQVADIFTKPFTEPAKWRPAIEAIKVTPPQHPEATRATGCVKEHEVDTPKLGGSHPCPADSTKSASITPLPPTRGNHVTPDSLTPLRGSPPGSRGNPRSRLASKTNDK